MMTSGPEAGWYRDPSGRHEHRWWDGASWTPYVLTLGLRSVDYGDPDGSGTAGADQAEAPNSEAPNSEVPDSDAPDPESPAADAVGPVASSRPLAAWVVVFVGAALLVVGALLPWGEATSKTASFSSDGIDGNGVITIIAAVVLVLVVLVVQRPTTAAWLVIATAVVAGAIGVRDAVDLSDKAARLVDQGPPPGCPRTCRRRRVGDDRRARRSRSSAGSWRWRCRHVGRVVLEPDAASVLLALVRRAGARCSASAAGRDCSVPKRHRGAGPRSRNPIGRPRRRRDSRCSQLRAAREGGVALGDITGGGRRDGFVGAGTDEVALADERRRWWRRARARGSRNWTNAASGRPGVEAGNITRSSRLGRPSTYRSATLVEEEHEPATCIVQRRPATREHRGLEGCV